MSALISVYSTRAGQGSTFWATCLAWTLAEDHTVMLVDADMEGGTIADLLYLRTDNRSLGTVFGDRPTRPDELLEQAVDVPKRNNLRIVPGLRSSYGYEISECLMRLQAALTGMPDDIVIVDLGHPLSHPALRSPRKEAEAICKTFNRAFVVLRDDPVLMARSINVLRVARPPHGEIIICHQRSGAMRKDIAATIAQEIPDLPVRDTWAWDEKHAQQMSDSGKPMTLPGIAKVLGI